MLIGKFAPNTVHHRFVDTRFVDGFLGHEKSTNRVRGGFQKTKCKIYFLTIANLIIRRAPQEPKFFSNTF